MIAVADIATARRALSLWSGTSVGVLSFRGATGSSVYATRFDGRTCFLRLTDGGFRTEAETREELAFIEHLARSGVSVARPLPSRQGKMIEPVASLDGRVQFGACLFARASSADVEPGSAYWNSKFFHHYGAYLASLHLAARTHRPEADTWRSDWRREPVVIAGLSRIRATDSVLARAIDHLHRTIGDHADAFGDEGMGHADFAPQNIRYLPTGQITAFDFSNCCRHWFLYDLAVAIHVLRHAPDRDTLQGWVIEGYRSVTPVPGNIDLIDPLLRLRSLYVYCDRLFRFGPTPTADQLTNLRQIRDALLAGRYR